MSEYPHESNRSMTHTLEDMLEASIRRPGSPLRSFLDETPSPLEEASALDRRIELRLAAHRARLQNPIPRQALQTADFLPVIFVGILVIALLLGFISVDIARIADAIAASEARV